MGKLRYALLIGVLILGVLCNGCSFSSKEDGKPHNGYYQYVAMSPDGKFTCRGKVDEAEAKKGGIYYKVEMDEHNKDFLRKITAVLKDKPTDVMWNNTLHDDEDSHFASVEINEDNGYLVYTFKNQANQNVGGFYRATFIKYKMGEKNQCSNAYIYSRGNLTGQMLLGHDDKGKLVKICYTGKNGERIASKPELRLSYEQKQPELLSQVEFLGEDGTPSIGERGYAIKKFFYDDKGRITEIQHLRAVDQLTDEQEKWFLPSDVWTSEFDAGKIRLLPDDDIKSINAVMNFFSAGKLEYGAITKYTYRADKYVADSISFYGSEGQRIGIEKFNGVSSIKLAYDENNNVVDWSAFGIDESPKAVDEGKASSWCFAYDENGRILEMASKDGEGQLVAVKTKDNKDNKVAKLKFTYNEDGEISSISCYGSDGNPSYQLIYGVYKVHQIQFTHDGDKSGNWYKYYDVNGKEIIIKPEGFLYGTWKYDRAIGYDNLLYTFTEDNKIYTNIPGGETINFKVKSDNLLIHGKSGELVLEKDGWKQLSKDLHVRILSPDKIEIREFFNATLSRVK